MNEDLMPKSDDELWSMWNTYISEAGKIKRELDRREHPTKLMRQQQQQQQRRKRHIDPGLGG